MPAATLRHPVRRRIAHTTCALCLLALAARAGAQEPAPRPAQPTVPAPDPTEVDSAAAPAVFACEPGGATEEVEFGCRLLARPTVERFPKGPVHWHLARYGTREQAQVAGRFTDIVTEVGGEVWLHRFGPESDVPRAGTRTATVGPLPIPRAAAYQIDVFYAVLPAGARTAALTHPGPAAWYVLEGEQCVETSRGVVQATVGEGAVAPPAGTPMQWVNTGAESERAFLVLVRDVGRARATPSRWKPKGACHAPSG